MTQNRKGTGSKQKLTTNLTELKGKTAMKDLNRGLQPCRTVTLETGTHLMGVAGPDVKRGEVG